jgi:hypothetical protein
MTESPTSPRAGADMAPSLSGDAPRCPREAQQQGGAHAGHDGALAAVHASACALMAGALADCLLPAAAWPCGHGAAKGPWHPTPRVLRSPPCFRPLRSCTSHVSTDGARRHGRDVRSRRGCGVLQCGWRSLQCILRACGDRDHQHLEVHHCFLGHQGAPGRARSRAARRSAWRSSMPLAGGTWRQPAAASLPRVTKIPRQVAGDYGTLVPSQYAFGRMATREIASTRSNVHCWTAMAGSAVCESWGEAWPCLRVSPYFGCSQFSRWCISRT